MRGEHSLKPTELVWKLLSEGMRVVLLAINKFTNHQQPRSKKNKKQDWWEIIDHILPIFCFFFTMFSFFFFLIPSFCPRGLKRFKSQSQHSTYDSTYCNQPDSFTAAVIVLFSLWSKSAFSRSDDVLALRPATLNAHAWY